MRPVAILAATLALATPSGADGQDQFGRAVSIGEDGAIYVAKPGPSRGPAGVFVYRAGTDGSWDLTSTLQLPGAAESGHSLSPSVASAGNLLLIGAGDPDAVQGAYAFQYGQGEWTDMGPLPFRSAPPAPATGAVDFAGILRILQPPPRMVVVDGPLAAISGPAEGAGNAQMVRVYRMDGSGWAPDGEIRQPEGNRDPAFGSALAVANGAIVVGSPGHGQGVVYRFSRQGSAWAADGQLSVEPQTTDSTATPEQFGAALSVGDGRMLVGAPGASNRAGAAYLFDLSSPSDDPLPFRPWTDDEGQGFGAAVALRGSSASI
ncbi:MAG: hypothetical protein OEO23_09420, partial [Gemmatimonadota bacterium]|nr:hypothetical protein [Gemmatimonadota bacterium]